MSLPYKLDPEMAKVLKSYLDKLDIKNKRVIFDLENETLEEEEYSIDDIIASAGILTKRQAEELLKEVEDSREEWD